jgi:hypothetical protein
MWMYSTRRVAFLPSTTPMYVDGYRGRYRGMGVLKQRAVLSVATVLIVSATTFAATAPAAPSASRSYKLCKNVVIRNSDESVYTRTHGLFVERTNCGTGRRVARKYLVDDGDGAKNPLGFHCSGGTDGVACRNGRKKVTWGYTYDRSALVAAARGSCGTFNQRGYTFEVDVERGSNVKCERAEQVTESFFFHKEKWEEHGGPSSAQTSWQRHGWSCGLGAGGGGCTRKRDQARFYYQVVGMPSRV